MNRVGERAERHWVLLRVLEASGRDALGAVVTIRSGERTWRREVRAAYSYQASNDPRVHLGLGDLDGELSLEVRWPDGETTTFGPLAVDREHTLRREG